MIRVFTIDLSSEHSFSGEELQKDLNDITSRIDKPDKFSNKSHRYEIIAVYPALEHHWEVLVVTKVIDI